MHVAAVIVAAGRGTRAGDGLPKQWRQLAGQSVAQHTISRFKAHPAIRTVLVVIQPEDAAYLPKDTAWTEGGATRDASVRAGLEALQGQGVDRVLIHDVARPCVSAGVIDAVIKALDTAPAAAPALAVTDALWQGAEGKVTGTQDRDGLFRAQTPQGFDFKAILSAHRSHGDQGAADDVEVARRADLPVAIVRGEEDNLKITTAADFDRAERILKNTMDVRLGNGFDVHRFCAGDHVVLCGVNIPHVQALEGHSDADVGMHAVTDAIYGALAMGDIGQHFPPSDPRWRGAASHIFLAHACDLARENGFKITHADCTLVCEFPKIGPHAAEMRSTMAAIMGIETDRMSVKATTSERLGFTGRGEGIAALATATLVKS